MLNLIENRQIRIFISSTFRDMMDERDYLVTKVFPSLRRYCEERDVTLFELDLRWGITEEESKQGKVVETCLHEIDNTKPFFIGLLGERYGWVPSESEQQLIDKNSNVLSEYPWVKDELNKGTSITEIEIQEGVLRAQEKINAYFYFRSSQVEIPPEYREESGSLAAQKLAKLKDNIREQQKYPVVEFLSKEELGQMVEKDFKELVNNLFPKGYVSELEKARLEQRSYFKKLTNIYIPTNSLFDTVDNFINGKESVLVITGECGIGKSALLANWIKKKENEANAPKILYHFVGVTRMEGNFRKIRQRLINEIRKIFGIVQTLEEKIASGSTLGEELSVDDKKKNELQRNLFSIPKNERLVIILDGVDKLIDNDNAKSFGWLSTYPDNVKFIFSTPENDSAMNTFKQKNYPVVVIPVLDIESRKQLIKDYLLSFGKRLTSDQVDRIANDEESGNPMTLCALLDELRFFGVYEKLDEEIDKYIVTPSISDFYVKVLERLEKTFDYTDTVASNLAMDILALLYVSREGLSETEIMALTDAKPIYWSQMYNALGNNLTVRRGLLNFSHHYIREAIERKYFSNKDNANSYRIWLISYFKTSQEVLKKRKYNELPYQFYHLRDWDGLYRFLMNKDVFESLREKDVLEFVKYWRALRNVDKKKYPIEKYFEFYKKKDRNELTELYDMMSWLIQFIGDDTAMALKYSQYAMAIREEIEQEHGNTADDFDYNRMGVLHCRTGNYQKALEYFQKALDIQKNTRIENQLVNIAIIYSNIGIAYASIGDCSQALMYAEQALNAQKEASVKNVFTAVAYYNIGSVYLSVGNKQNAVELFQQALNIQKEVLGEEDPQTVLIRNNLIEIYRKQGVVFFNNGDYDLAINELTQAIKLFPTNGSVYALRAAAYYQKGDSNAAITDINNAIDLGCKDALEVTTKLILEKGNRHYKSRDYDKAIAEYTDAIEFNPSYAMSYNSRGNALYSKKEYGQAIADYSQAIALNPNDVVYYSNRGGAFKCKGDYERAIRDYTESIRLNPNNAKTYNLRGVVYYSQRDYGRAIVDFNQAIKLVSSDAVYYSNRGNAYRALKDNDKAIADYKMVLEIDPNNAYAKKTLESMLKE